MLPSAMTGAGTLSLIFALLTLPSSILTGLPLSPMEVAVLGRNDFDILVLELSWRYSLKVSWIALLNKMEEVAVLDVSILDDMVDMTVGFVNARIDEMAMEMVGTSET
jgi:hypothetical protein